MCTKEIIITNKTGIHARPASEFVRTAKKFDSKIVVTNLTSLKSADAKSMIKVLSLALVKGTKLRIEADGDDEENAAEALNDLVKSGFGEN